MVLSRGPSNFLLYGLDLIVTSDLIVKLIETNNYPLWYNIGTFVKNMTQQMGVSVSFSYNYLCCVFIFQNDMFDILFDCRRYPNQFGNMRPGDMYGTWTHSSGMNFMISALISHLSTPAKIF